MDNRPIGVFDSGLGGLTAVKRMHEIMPNENIIYFGDTGRVPYGTRSPQTIIKYTKQDIAFLRSFDIKAIIVACGTVSSVALNSVAHEHTDIPIFGVVQPACKKALNSTKNGRIGIIGTPGTIKSKAYETYLKEHRQDLHLIARACPLFVSLVENGRFNVGDIVIETVAKEYLADIKKADVDTLILGCTHYPLLKDIIANEMGDKVTLIDPGAEAAEYAKSKVLAAQGVGETKYFVSDEPTPFNKYATMFLQSEPNQKAEQIDITSY